MYQQVYDPVAGSLAWSAVCAALPLVSLFVLLGGLRWKAWKASLVALAVALLVALLAYRMPATQALLAGSEGAAFGLFPILWIVINAIWIYRMTEATGWDHVLRRSFGSLSDDHRIQAVLIAFCFGALLEALAGFGTPVAISAAMLIAVGLRPLKAAAVSLVANTAPVAFGAIAVPITTLGKTASLDANTLGAMVGRQTPLLALVVPFVLVFMVDGRRGLRETWPAALAGGFAFAAAQFVTSNYLAYEITDIVAAFVGALAVVLLLRVWQPAWHSDEEYADYQAPPVRHREPRPVAGGAVHSPAFEAETHRRETGDGSPLMAFAPYLIIVVIFSLSQVGPIKAWLDAHGGWTFRWPGLSVADASGHPLSAATYAFTVVSGAGTMLLVSGVLTALLYRIGPGRAARLWLATVVAFRWTIVTVMAVLALAYVMNFSGQTVTLGQFLSKSGQLFALLSPIVGWLGVAVTGSDTSSNALFGLLQKTAAQETGTSAYLLAAANTSGGVLGKMISPQNLAVAAAVVCLEGHEGDLFRHVVLWSLGLLAVLCVLVFLQSTPVLGWMVTGP